MELKNLDVFKLEDEVWIANRAIGIPAYDFKFENLFACRRPYELPKGEQLICRIGAPDDYSAVYSEFLDIGFQLINNVQEHDRASQLHEWYPLIKQYTPKSMWYEEIPNVKEVEEEFDYPVFIKGTRQTAKHDKSLCVAHNRQECEEILKRYKSNPILHWQKLVCREFVPLQPVEAPQTYKVSPSFEFRSFWYRQELVGVGHYWSEFVEYDWSPEQKVEALNVARKVVESIKVPFVAIDLALTQDNRWIVIECNDAQESGYAGVSPIQLWKNIIQCN
ncbi:ATP-grasp domain-containing protein [Pleionea sediminis]|uniref:ATP-grasp domain-containing protein n=1 Tax=Pleionea sediminis TaxID=2569479 RepID=UPI0011851629|nr:ATP-grasp domain-containing protein [Pleionea sediminis]